MSVRSCDNSNNVSHALDERGVYHTRAEEMTDTSWMVWYRVYREPQSWLSGTHLMSMLYCPRLLIWESIKSRVIAVRGVVAKQRHRPTLVVPPLAKKARRCSLIIRPCEALGAFFPGRARLPWRGCWKDCTDVSDEWFALQEKGKE